MKIMKTCLYVIMPIFFLSFILYGQKVETVEGVKIVHNAKGGKWGKNPKVTLELVNMLGDVNADDENLAFHMPADIAVDTEGNLYVLDSGNHRIQKFNRDGEHLVTLGRQGQGPGEFYFPSSLDIDSQGYLYVSDPNNQRIQILTPTGKEHRTIRIVEDSVGDIILTRTGQLVMAGGQGFGRLALEEEKAKELPKLVKILDADGNVLRKFGVQHDFKDFLLNRMGNQVQFAVDKDDNIYLVFLFQNRIEKYSLDGKLLWKADRELNYSMDPPKDKGKMERRGGGVSVQMPQMNRSSNGIAADEKGRIWVVTLNRQIKEEERVNQMVTMNQTGGERTMSFKAVGNTELQKTDMYKLEVFDPDGVLLGEIPLDHFVDGIFIENGRLFLPDKLRGTKFYEYKIKE